MSSVNFSLKSASLLDRVQYFPGVQIHITFDSFHDKQKAWAQRAGLRVLVSFPGVHRSLVVFAGNAQQVGRQKSDLTFC